AAPAPSASLGPVGTAGGRREDPTLPVRARRRVALTASLAGLPEQIERLRQRRRVRIRPDQPLERGLSAVVVTSAARQRRCFEQRLGRQQAVGVAGRGPPAAAPSPRFALPAAARGPRASPVCPSR